MKEENNGSNHFTNTEVGALIESFRNDISGIAKDLGSVKNDVGDLKTDVRELKTDMKLVKDVLRIEIPKINHRFDRIESHTGLA